VAVDDLVLETEDVIVLLGVLEGDAVLEGV
jgi:hypothetical protein